MQESYVHDAEVADFWRLEGPCTSVLQPGALWTSTLSLSMPASKFDIS